MDELLQQSPVKFDIILISSSLFLRLTQDSCSLFSPTFAIKKKISLYQGFWATVTTDIPKVLLRLNFFL